MTDAAGFTECRDPARKQTGCSGAGLTRQLLGVPIRFFFST